MEKWDDLLRKYKIQYIKSYFHEDSTTNNEEDRLFNIINSPKANKFIYVRDPYTSTDEYILKVPLKVATKMVLLGTLP